MQFALDAAHVRDAQRAKIEDRAGSFGDYVHASAAFDDVSVDSYSPAQVIPFLNTLELPRELVNCVNTFVRRKACM